MSVEAPQPPAATASLALSLERAASTSIVGRSRPVAVLALAVVLAAVAVRLGHLADQSYWTDETFSVNQAAGSLNHALVVGRTEIHTPLYALLLLVWIRLGGTSTLWTHALSAIVGLLAIIVSYTGSRRAALSHGARWTAVAGTATCGMAIVYAQETRPYSLAFLGATGVAAASAAMDTALLDGGPLPWCPWLGWGLLAATAHLLGAVLVAVVTAALVALTLLRGRSEDARRVGLSGAAALVPQVAWLSSGLSGAGFAAGTSWIPAPKPGDVLDVLTSVFSAGGLEHRAGFAWASPLGLVAVLLLALGGLTVRGRGSRHLAGAATRAATHAGALSRPAAGTRSPTTTPPTTMPARDGRLAGFQLAVAAGTIVATYAVAQIVHIWTLRNMIVLAPSLTWGITWGLVGLPRSERGARLMACLLLVGMAASLASTGLSLRQPYKTDWRSAILLLAHMRAEQPAATFTFFRSVPVGEYVAADRGARDPYVRRIGARVRIYRGPPASGFAGVTRIPGPQAVLYYPGLKDAVRPGLAIQILERLADPTCHQVPLYGLVLVTCPGTTAAVTARPASR